MATLYRTDRAPQEVAPANQRYFLLSEIRSLLGRESLDVALLRGADVLVYSDAPGPLNPGASAILAEATGRETVFGDALVCDAHEAICTL